MLLNPEPFEFVARIEASFPVFAREFETLSRDDFILWPDRGAYQGEWLALPLFVDGSPPELEPLLPVNQRKCPATMQALRAIPRVVTAGYSWMEPGCHILPHTDSQPPDRVRVHLGIEVPEGARMRVGERFCGWAEQRAIVFDGLTQHETANESLTERRVVLLVDVDLTPEEIARRAPAAG